MAASSHDRQTDAALLAASRSGHRRQTRQKAPETYEEKPVVDQVPSLADRPDGAETTLTAEAASTLHPLAHWNEGAVPDPPVKLAPVLLSTSELAGSVKPEAT